MTIHLSIVLFLPLAAGVLGALLPRGLARWTVLAGTVAVLAYTVAMLLDFESGGGLQWVTDDEWISELGIRYQLGSGRAQPVHGRPDRGVVGALRAHRGLPRARPAEAVLLLAGPRRNRGARRVHGAGPGAVHRLLRPDAGALLLHDRWLGHWRPRAGHHQVRDLHAGRLAADAGRGDRARGAGHARRRRDLLLARHAGAANGGRGQPAVDRASVRARLLRQGAAIPAARVGAGDLPLVPHRDHRAAVGGALQGRRLRLPAHRAADHARGLPALAGAVPGHRRLLDPLRVDPGLLPGQRAAGGGLLLDRPAGLHRARHLRPRRQGRPGRGAADGQPRHRGGGPVLDHQRRGRAGGRQRVARRAGGHGVPGARAGRRCS